MEKIEITKEEYEEYIRLKKKEENTRKLKSKNEQDLLHSRIIAMSIEGMEDRKIVEEFAGKLSRASIYKTIRVENDKDEQRIRKLYDRKELIAFRDIEKCEIEYWLDDRRRKVEARKQNKNRRAVKSVEEIIEEKKKFSL